MIFYLYHSSYSINKSKEVKFTFLKFYKHLLMKNIKFFVLSTLLMSLFILSSCGGDETQKNNSISFDGEKSEIVFAGLDMGDYGDGNYEIVFLPSELDGSDPWSQNVYFAFQISSEWDGTEVDLTEIDNLFDWSWYVELQTVDDYLWGFGGATEEFNDVTGGSFKIEELDAEERTFEVTANVEFGDRTLKVYYKGQLEPYNVSVAARTQTKGKN